MRLLLLLSVVLLAGCGSADDEAITDNRSTVIRSAEERPSFAGPGRDRLCFWESDGRVGIVSYAAAGDANCSLRGRMAGNILRPEGDDTCQITVERQNDTIRIANVGAACAYYCGPGASLEGKTFARMDRPEPVTDIAGDPLC